MKGYPQKQFSPESFERHVLDNGFGKPIALDAAPTTVGNQLPKHGDSGYFGSTFYITLGATTYSIALTAV